MHFEVAHQLIGMLRSGAFSGGSAPFKKVIGVGHSVGSITTNGVTAKYPKDFDAVVLTGFSVNQPGGGLSVAGINLQIAALADPARFDGLAYDYASSGSEAAIEFFFFKAPNFPPALLDMSLASKQTLSVGEMLTEQTSPAKNFTGPVFVVNGENDMPNCVGNCMSPVNIQAQVLKEYYQAANNGSSYFVLPVCGHGLNAHYTANVAYDQIHTWLQKNGF
jgi:pimeloyl-ACP methyl ester carboxylesterase